MNTPRAVRTPRFCWRTGIKAGGVVAGAAAGFAIVLLTLNAFPSLGIAPLRSRPVLAGSTVKVMVDRGISEGYGSGVHLGGGRVLTAWHVVRGGTARVKTSEGHTSEPAELLWFNAKHDIALIRAAPVLAAKGQLSCRLAPVGAAIEAVGNPVDVEFVRLRGNIITGMVNRSREHGPGWPEAIIADMSVGPGMSGGPVFNHWNEVVGIVVGMIEMPLAIIVPSPTICALLGR